MIQAGSGCNAVVRIVYDTCEIQQSAHLSRKMYVITPTISVSRAAGLIAHPNQNHDVTILTSFRKVHHCTLRNPVHRHCYFHPSTSHTIDWRLALVHLRHSLWVHLPHFHKTRTSRATP